jgi:hypothetical protein
LVEILIEELNDTHSTSDEIISDKEVKNSPSKVKKFVLSILGM